MNTTADTVYSIFISYELGYFQPITIVHLQAKSFNLKYLKEDEQAHPLDLQFNELLQRQREACLLSSRTATKVPCLNYLKHFRPFFIIRILDRGMLIPT